MTRLPGPPALAVRGLGKRFGDRTAFEDVSFEIGYGQVLASATFDRERLIIR